MTFPPFLALAASRLRNLRDPQVQVWGLAGISVLLLIIGHLRAWSPAGESKKPSDASAARILLAGASLAWTDEFAPRAENSARPVFSLSDPVFPPSPPSLELQRGPRLDLRPVMEQAASRPWKFLDRPLRDHLAAAPPADRPLKVRLGWSGDDRGNAALLARQQPESAGAVIVIGNGSRSGDGCIELAGPEFSFADGTVEIVLIGAGGLPGERQNAALGEILHHLEAISGRHLTPDNSAPARAMAMAAAF